MERTIKEEGGDLRSKRKAVATRESTDGARGGLKKRSRRWVVTNERVISGGERGPLSRGETLWELDEKTNMDTKTKK